MAFQQPFTLKGSHRQDGKGAEETTRAADWFLMPYQHKFLQLKADFWGVWGKVAHCTFSNQSAVTCSSSSLNAQFVGWGGTWLPVSCRAPILCSCYSCGVKSVKQGLLLPQGADKTLFELRSWKLELMLRKKYLGLCIQIWIKCAFCYMFLWWGHVF